jgi:hypothetical protein
MRGGVSRGVQPLEVMPTHSVLQLLPAGEVWDGQAQEWWGDLLCYYPGVPASNAVLRGSTLLAAQASPFHGCATNWASSGALGPFGHIPQHPSWVTDPVRTTALERARFDEWYRAPGQPWADLQRGLLSQAGSTGDQPDFGVVKMLHVFHTGLPACVEEARHAAGEEAHRTNHHREDDGSIVRSANHPNWTTWSGRTHFNTTVSRDRLGKPYPEPYAIPNGWGSKDNQHWSSLTLAAGFLLTRSYSLEMDILSEVETYMAGHTLPSMKPGWSTNSMDSPRAVGRTFLSMSWHYLLTGREDLRQRMTERVRQCVAQQWVGRNVAGPVRPLHVTDPDPRIIANYEFWRPWEDALAVLGLEAVHRVSGQQEARDIARALAKSLFTYGWHLINGSSAEIATGIRWIPDGRSLTPAEYADPTMVVWSTGAGFELWSMPAAKLARQYAIQSGDADLLTRAQIVLQSLAGGRRTPTHRRWDPYYEWDALP